MVDTPPEPLPPSPVRPPVPGWMWWRFILVPVGVCASWAVVNSLRGAGGLLTAPITGGSAGLLLSLPFLAGLALSERCFHGTTGRIMGGLVFGTLLLAVFVVALFLLFVRLNGNRLWQS